MGLESKVRIGEKIVPRKEKKVESKNLGEKEVGNWEAGTRKKKECEARSSQEKEVGAAELSVLGEPGVERRRHNGEKDKCGTRAHGGVAAGR
eukprot:4200987-Pleurochrysis_carterae.AAC.1